MPTIYLHDPFLAVQRLLVSPWLDGPMSAASVACEGWSITLVAIAFLRSRHGGRAAWRSAAPLAIGLLLAGLTIQVLKHAIALPRPLSVFGPGAVHVLLQPLRYDSFPSGHSASAAALAAWGVRRHGWAAWPLALLAIVGGASRVYVGAHWTFDVLAGWAVGVSAAAAAEPLWERLRARVGRERLAPLASRLRAALPRFGIGLP